MTKSLENKLVKVAFSMYPVYSAAFPQLMEAAKMKYPKFGATLHYGKMMRDMLSKPPGASTQAFTRTI